MPPGSKGGLRGRAWEGRVRTWVMSVLSRAPWRTNMPSTPIPIMMNGRIDLHTRSSRSLLHHCTAAATSFAPTGALCSRPAPPCARWHSARSYMRAQCDRPHCRIVPRNNRLCTLRRRTPVQKLGHLHRRRARPPRRRHTHGDRPTAGSGAGSGQACTCMHAGKRKWEHT